MPSGHYGPENWSNSKINMTAFDEDLCSRMRYNNNDKYIVNVDLGLNTLITSDMVKYQDDIIA